jgi:integrase
MRRKGEGSGRQRPDGGWEVRRTIGGRQQSFYGRTEQEAWDKAEAGRPPVRGKDYTLSGWLDIWLAGRRDRVSARTTADRERLAEWFIRPYLGRWQLRELDQRAVGDWVCSLIEAGRTADQQDRALKLLRMTLKAAFRLGLLARSPAELVEPPRAKRVRRGLRSLTVEQLTRLLDAAQPDRLCALYALAADSGMRPGELYALHWPELDLSAGAVTVRRSLEEVNGVASLKEPKTPESYRTLPLGRLAVDALRDHRQRMRVERRDVEAGPVFVGRHGGWLRGQNLHRRSLHPHCDRAGIPRIRLYDLRHTCATLLLADQVPIKVVQERLGHASPNLTLSNYAHCLPSMQQAAVESINRLFGGTDGHDHRQEG